MNTILQGTDLAHIIKSRRTIKPEKMNGRLIPEAVIVELLTLADWAPTHGRTEPWRFIVVAPNKVKEFSIRHANLYKQHTDPTSFTEEKFNKIVALSENTSHIIVAWMRRNPSHKVPEIEEVAAASAAIQNLLLAATSNGLATFWNSGGLTHHPAFKEEFKMGPEDLPLGIIYLGYSDEPLKEGVRMIPLSEKIEWLR